MYTDTLWRIGGGFFTWEITYPPSMKARRERSSVDDLCCPVSGIPTSTLPRMPSSAREGLQIEMHAIGDAAFDQAVMAIETALKDCPRKDHRHGIIHACLPSEEGLQKCAELGIQIPLQPAFLMWDLEPLEFLNSILGERTERLSPLRKMTDMGIVLSGDSDAPCTLPDPIFGIHAACNHYIPEQSVTIPEALKMFTYHAAWTTFDEKERGSLETGKMADMVILNRNPLEMKPDALLNLKVEQLLLNGRAYKQGQVILSLLAKGLLSGGRV